MQKGNVIDFSHYRNQQDADLKSNEKHTISKELEDAIAHLILRLRELGPLPTPN